MPKYRKKPVIVEAYQTDKEIIIRTLEGDMKASVGDYIVTGVNGEQYPCKPDIFEKTYELAVNNNADKKLTDMESTEALYIRFGEIPEDERSIIYQNGEIIVGKEKGVSVWKAIEVSGYYYYPLLPENVNENTIIDYFDYLIDGNKNVYLVTGNELETHGSDGEPLLRNVKIIKDITDRYKKGKLQNIQAENENLKEKNSNLTSDLTSLQNNLTSLQAENTELLEKIKKLQDEYKWLDQESDILAADVNALNHFLETAKAEAYKEFATKTTDKVEKVKQKYERLCKEQGEKMEEHMHIHFNGIIKIVKDLLKELGVDGKEGET